jgi:hypothetical protein
MVIEGSPSAEEAAAILAAVQVVLEAEATTAPQVPWAYRSAWRRAAIAEGATRANDLGGRSVS